MKEGGGDPDSILGDAQNVGPKARTVNPDVLMNLEARITPPKRSFCYQ
jgi:hypothetical protein